MRKSPGNHTRPNKEVPAVKYGVDLSFWKTPPNWSQVQGIDFAVLGITELNGPDRTFEPNYSGCHANGIPVGVYKLSYAHSADAARKEVSDILAILGGRPIEMGIWLDLENDGGQHNLSVQTRSEIIEAFREAVEAGGYEFGGIYSNASYYHDYIPTYAKTKYRAWLASYAYNDTGNPVEGLKPDANHLSGWQYSENGHPSGFGGQAIDMDIWYDEIPSVNATETPVRPSAEVKPMLSYGNTGNAVVDLQRRLNDYGFGLDEDGIFGDKTKAAVIRYQEMHGLAPDGIVGPLTLENLDAPFTPLELAFKTLCDVTDEWSNNDPFWNTVDTICTAWKAGKIAIKG